MSKLSRLSKKWAWAISLLLVLGLATAVYAFTIRDPSGTPMHVDSHNRGEVYSTNVHEEHYVSHHAHRAFFVSSGASNQLTHTMTATGGYLLYLENDDSDRDLIIEKVLLNCSAAMDWAWMRNPTLGTISNHNVITSCNNDFGSSIAASATVYAWNEAGTGMGGITSGVTVSSFTTAAGFNVAPIDGAIVLGEDNIFAVQAFGAGEVSVGVRFYFEEVH